MKINLLLLMATASCLHSAPVFAFPPDIEIGAGTFIAKKACPELKINANDEVDIIADYTHLEVLRGDNRAPSGFDVLLKFSIPDDGGYSFQGPIGLQTTNEFVTNNFSGDGPYYRIKGNDTTGDATITDDQGACYLTNNTGG